MNISEAHVLPYQDEQLMDKWLMMYLETHPKYQGQEGGTGGLHAVEKAVDKIMQCELLASTSEH